MYIVCQVDQDPFRYYYYYYEIHYCNKIVQRRLDSIFYQSTSLVTIVPCDGSLSSNFCPCWQ